MIKLKVEIDSKNTRKSQSQKVEPDKRKRNEEKSRKKGPQVAISLETAARNVINCRVDYARNDDQMLEFSSIISM